ncbi:hypothetical protein ACFKHW_07145 [Bradyrhizobium lupini]|uniref:hypothetical protein n=1 Tax=Rhizobium lupini TaxID=136996 RepID=UPI00366FC285
MARQGVVFAGPTDADLWICEISLGRALAVGHTSNIVFHRDKINALRAAGPRRSGTGRKFTRVELIEMKIARAFMASHAENTRYLIGERAQQIVLELRSGG